MLGRECVTLLSFLFLSQLTNDRDAISCWEGSMWQAACCLDYQFSRPTVS